ncbi:MAG: DUF2235 domain-containing protein [Victivallaceae bacterium]
MAELESFLVTCPVGREQCVAGKYCGVEDCDALSPSPTYETHTNLTYQPCSICKENLGSLFTTGDETFCMEVFCGTCGKLSGYYFKVHVVIPRCTIAFESQELLTYQTGDITKAIKLSSGKQNPVELILSIDGDVPNLNSATLTVNSSVNGSYAIYYDAACQIPCITTGGMSQTKTITFSAQDLVNGDYTKTLYFMPLRPDDNITAELSIASTLDPAQDSIAIFSGCSSCGTGQCEPLEVNAGLDSVHLSASLGSGNYKMPAGEIRLNAEALDVNVFARENFKVQLFPGTTATYRPYIDYDPASEYPATVSTGLYTFTFDYASALLGSSRYINQVTINGYLGNSAQGSAFKTIVMTLSPDASEPGSYLLEISQTSGAAVKNARYSCMFMHSPDFANASVLHWHLEEWSGNDTDDIQSTWLAQNTQDGNIVEFRYEGSLNTPLSKTKTVKKKLSNGEYLVLETQTGNDHVNYSYNENNQLTKVEYQDGRSVSYYDYDEEYRFLRMSEKIGSHTIDTEYEYTLAGDKVTTTRTTKMDQTMTAKEVTEKYKTVTSNPDISKTYYSSVLYLTTKTYYLNDQTSRYHGRVSKVLHPDGTVTIYTYGVVSGGTDEILTVANGVPNNALDPTDITEGRKTVTINDSNGRTKSVSSYIVYPAGTSSAAQLVEQMTYSQYDSFGRAGLITYLDGSYETKVYGCCGLESSTDRAGTVTTYTYNSTTKQLESQTSAGVTTQYTYDVDGNLLRTTLCDDEDHTICVMENRYSNGKLVETKNPLGFATKYEDIYQSSGTDVIKFTVTTAPDASEVISRYVNGQLEATLGDGVHAQIYSYGPKWEKVSPQNITTNTDMMGRTVLVRYADNSAAVNYYNSRGQLERSSTPGGVLTIYEYDNLGRTKRIATDMDGNSTITTPDITAVITYGYGVVEGKFCSIVTTSRAGKVISCEKQSYDGLYSETSGMNNQLATIRTRTYNTAAGTMVDTVTAPDDTSKITVYKKGLVDTVTSKDPAGNAYSVVKYLYDGFNRVSSVSEKNGSGDGAVEISRVSYTYDDAGNVLSETVGIPDDDPLTQDTLTTSHEYDSVNREIKTILPSDPGLSREKNRVYYPTGELKFEYGADTYPVKYTYNPIWGGVATMTTYQTPGLWNSGSPAANAGNTTTWAYDERGFMFRKTKADGTHVDYEYDGDGNVIKRRWARGVYTLYNYDKAGRLSGKAYHLADDTVDSGTPAIGYTYDTLGRPLTAGGIGYAYNATTGYLTGMGGMTYTYDAYGRRQSATDGRHATSYTYDARSRFNTVGDGAATATYGYDAKALPRETNISANGSWVLTQTRNYDLLNRLALIETVTPPVSMQPNGYSSSYTYNNKNQRATHTPSLGPAMKYGYDDDHGQLYTETLQSQTVPERTYRYDLIGNRIQYISGSTVLSYASNALNQYFTITSQTAPTYDLDGNMLTWNGKTFTWDGENRLKSVTVGSDTWEYAYDALNRRTSETFWEVGMQYMNKFTYDGYNVHTEAKYNTANQLQSWIGYTWGKDLSDTVEGAGGVGGLLWQTTSSGETSYPMYDGNGNITVYVNPAGEYQAVYAYDGFLNVSQPFPQTFTGSYRYQASTKSWNPALGLLEYQFRDYSPELGRWIQEDPIKETGGCNLYGFVYNCPVYRIDSLGLVLFAFDGTGNNRDYDKWGSGGNAPTNIAIMYDLYPKNMRKKYLPGPGTKEQDWLDRKMGIIAGYGIARNINEAMNFYNEDVLAAKRECIDIIGFSRGAATARAFANKLIKEKQEYIRFIGIFDTVAQIGAPGSTGGYDLSIASNSVGMVAHAVAKNEYRYLFPLTSIANAYGDRSEIVTYDYWYWWGEHRKVTETFTYNAWAEDEYRTILGSNFIEQPFAGAHSDIGGGYQDGRNLDALRWMIRQGQVAGAPFNELETYPDIGYLKDGRHDSRYIPIGNTREIFPGNL